MTSTRQADLPCHRRGYLPCRVGIERQVDDDLCREQGRQGQLARCGTPLITVRVFIGEVATGEDRKVRSGRRRLGVVVIGGVMCGDGLSSGVRVGHGVPVGEAVPDLREENGQTQSQHQPTPDAT